MRAVRWRSRAVPWCGPRATLLLAAAAGSLALTPAAFAQPATLRVVTGYASPFVKQPGTPVSGYSIEIWQEVARRLGVDTAWTVLPDLSDAAQLAAVAEGRADLAISALAITAARNGPVDFTVPYYRSGLQILVGTGQEDGPLRIALASSALWWLLGIGGATALLLAHILWLVERDHNPAFRHGYLRSVSEGLWGVMLIVATGEHGDRDTPRVMKRIVVGAMWLFGVVLIAQFTATVTAALTVERLRSGIAGPADLPGKRIATAPGSLAASWLDARGLPYLPVSDSEQAYGMLVRGEIQAILYEAPQLRYWIATRGESMAALVGPVFAPEWHAIAVAPGSPLRLRINQALLAMQADGTAEEIERRWFGAPM